MAPNALSTRTSLPASAAVIVDTPDDLGAGRPRLSVVIATLGQRESLRRAVESVLAGMEAAVEVVVVVNGCDASTIDVDVPDDLRVTVERCGAVGVSAARNVGARASVGDWLAFLDDDDVVDPDWSVVGTSIADPTTPMVCVGARSVDEHGLVTSTFGPHAMGPVFDDLPGPLQAGNFFVRPEVFAAIGGYDETLRYAENTDLALRLADELGPAVSAAIPISERDVMSIERRSDREPHPAEDRLDAAVHLLDRHADRLGRSPVDLANHHSIAGVSAARLGRWREASRHFTRAVRAEPLAPSRWARVVIIQVPLLRGRKWQRRR